MTGAQRWRPKRNQYNHTTAPKPAYCRECGAEVVAFTCDSGFPRLIESHALPIDTDLRALRERGVPVWVHIPSPLAGEPGHWAHKFGSTRDWRDTRQSHECTQSIKEKAKA